MKQKKTFSMQGDTPCRRPVVQKGCAAHRGEALAPCKGSSAPANGTAAPCGESAALADWWTKYASVEDAIVSAQERRRISAMARRRSRAREFGDICEMTEGAAVRWRRDGFFDGEEFVCILFGDAGYYAYLDYMRRESGRRVSRLKAAVRRPSYYAAENARRRALAAERRKIHARRTDNECPTKEQILDAWIARRASHEDAIRFGSLIEDLECYIDNSLRRDEEGVIVGRNPGVKGWLRENIPVLALQYTTVMRYKAAAKKLKQITELSDPTPMDVVLPPKAAVAGKEKQDYGADEVAEGENRVLRKAKGEGSAAGTARLTLVGIADVPSVEVVRARAIWEEVVKGAGRSATALFARLDALLDPRRVEDANMLAVWREKYAKESTARTKKTWWLKRLWRNVG